jgi:hypothetical protein
MTPAEVCELITYAECNLDCGGCFAQAVKACVQSGAVSGPDIVAEHWGTSVPTVERWQAGYGLPHPLMRKHLLRWLGVKVFEWRERWIA